MLKNISYTVIIPTLNEADNLEELLPMLNDEQISEVIIADSPYSSDDSKAFVHNFNYTYVKCRKAGRAAQMNEGAELAKGNILHFIHADVRLYPGYLTDVLSSIRDHDAGMFSYRFDGGPNILKVNAFFTRYKGLFAGGGDQTLYIKKDVFQSLGGYNQQYAVMEDFDVVRRLRRSGKLIDIIQKPISVSARKYQDFSYFKVNVSNLLLMIFFYLGFSPNALRRFHRFCFRKE